MKYQLYLNIEKDPQGRSVGFDGYQPDHKMELADAGDIEPAADDAATLENLFYIYNVDFPAGYRNRSMSVGDVVVLDLGTPNVRAYSVASFGFDSLEAFNFPVPVN